jgi:hypothetical protein
MKRPPPNAICYLCVIAGLAIGYTAKTIDNQINGFSGVGGRQEYERQRAKHLDRLRRNEHVKDDAVRERDAAAIEAEIDELGRGFPVQELGEEVRRVK